MAFIKCPKCRRPVIDAARRCPGCGTPLSGNGMYGAGSPRAGRVLIFAGLAAAGGLLVAYVNGWISLSAPPPPVPAQEPTPLPRLDTKFGLTEDQRREVYRDLLRAEDHAQRETDRRYPPLNTGASDVRWQLHAEMSEHFRTQVEEEDKKAIAKRYGVSSSDLQAIGAEGFEKSWPRPARQSIR